MEPPLKIDIGCGPHKREGFFGIDIAPGPSVDLILDIERSPLPFPNDSAEHIYSSHAFEHFNEHLGSPIQVLREIMRVAKHGALVEIWIPYGKSDAAYLFGHHVFYTEMHWRHICFEFDDFYLGAGTLGRFDWHKTQYHLQPGILDKLRAFNVPIEFALEHMNNIAWEFGVFLQVDKTLTKARNPQVPIREICTGRYQVAETL
jgi:SAM-dependent methyltransferase